MTASPVTSAPRVVVVGMGSEWRRDDGIGPAVVATFARAVGERFAGSCRVVAPLADPFDLLGHWDDVELAVVVDATRTGLSPGTISVLDLDAEVSSLRDSGPGPHPERTTHMGPDRADEAVRWVPGARGSSSTHGVGLTGVLRLARAIGSAPARTVVVGVEGEDFGQGENLSPSVARVVDEAVGLVVEIVEETLECA